MTVHRGYYSLVQFCPDASRMEAVNLGVLLFCPDLKYLNVRLAAGNQRAEKLVARQDLERHALEAAKKALTERLATDCQSFRDVEDLKRFVNTRANWLKLTTPRSARVTDPEHDLNRMFAELVETNAPAKATPEPSKVLTLLSTKFEKLYSEGRAELKFPVTIPITKEPFNVPYAFRNGTWNLVKPQRFSSLNSVEVTALKGSLLSGHAEQNPMRLIVVSSIEEGKSLRPETVESLFKAFNVENVPEDRVPQFLDRVEREAHSVRSNKDHITS